MKVHRDWSSRKCPSCGEIFNKRLEIASTIPAEERSFDEIASAFIGFRTKQVFFSYYRCLRCALVYCPYYFSQGQLDELYEAMPDNLMGEDKSTISKTQSSYVNWMANRVQQVHTFLEIGPDIGLVTKAVTQKYELQHLGLVEPNVSVRDQLAENAKSVDSINLVSSVYELEPCNFDLIAGIHVYDHLLEPMKELTELAEFSSKASYLLVVVHNEASLLRKLLDSKWPPFCLQHPQLYNPLTLRDILRRAGWELEHLSKSTNWWHLDHFAEMGSGVMGLPTKWTKLLPSVELPTRLGNMIALARRG